MYLLVALLLLGAFYFLLRAYNLMSLPLFTDEAIYIRWAQIGLGDPLYRFVSLTDGKQPLFIWLMYPFLKIFDDPVIAGRAVSILTGFFTMLGLGLVSYTLFKKRTVALLTMLLYIAYPFAQVMDRMALYDSMVAMFFIWAVYFSILLIRYIRLDIAYTLGFVLGLGILTKTSNLLALLLMPLTLFLFDFKQKLWKTKLGMWALYALLAAIISQVMYAVLRLSPLPNVISEKNNAFYYPLSEWILNPFAYVIPNLQGLTPALVEYLTLPYIILIGVALVYWKKNWKEKLMLFAFFALPFIGFAFIAKSVFARYFFFMTLPLLLLAALGLVQLQETLVKKMQLKGRKSLVASTVLALLFIAYPLYVSLSFAQNPIYAPIANSDKNQYVTSWTGGWGLNETVDFFEEKAQEGKIYIATEGTFGLYPQGIELYLSQNPNISIKGYYWEIKTEFPEDLAKKATEMPTYFVFYQPCPGGFCPNPGDAPKGWPVTQVKEFTQPGTKARVVIYQVNAVE
jgi:4-amino-4-deoxy-L-arabinose transferase-like glycosyltransferase